MSQLPATTDHSAQGTVDHVNPALPTVDPAVLKALQETGQGLKALSVAADTFPSRVAAESHAISTAFVVGFVVGLLAAWIFAGIIRKPA